MESLLRQGVVELTKNKRALEILEKRGEVQMDKTANRRFTQVQYNAIFYKIYEGIPRTFPYNMAKAIMDSTVFPSYKKCEHCKAAGYTIAGVCPMCKGRKETLDDAQYHKILLTREFDPTLVDPTSGQPLSAEIAPPVEPASADSLAKEAAALV